MLGLGAHPQHPHLSHLVDLALPKGRSTENPLGVRTLKGRPKGKSMKGPFPSTALSDWDLLGSSRIIVQERS